MYKNIKVRNRVNILLIISIFVMAMFPSVALAKYPKKVERWRPEVRKQLKRHHLYSKERENRILNIIQHESGGNPKAGKGRACVGLVQFDKGWTRYKTNSKSYWKRHKIKKPYIRDGRLSGYWSIHRIVHVYKDGGTAAVKRH